jgi:hypothetical protein
VGEYEEERMLRNAVRFVGGVVALMVLVAPAGAEDPDGSVSIWFRGGGVYTSLDAANDLIDDGNAIFEEQGWTTVDDFKITYDLSADVHVAIGRTFVAYAGYGTIFGSQSTRFDREIEVGISGTPITAGLMYRLPIPDPWQSSLEDFDFFLGGGAVYLTDFEFRAQDDDVSRSPFLEERLFTGDGLGFEARFNTEFFLSPSFTLMAGVSYRHLKATDLDHEVRVYKPDVFNATGDADGDGIRNDRDPDYQGSDLLSGDGSFQRMYGRLVPDPENDGQFVWQVPGDRYLSPLYIYDENSFGDSRVPAHLRVHDPNASFDIDLSGIQVRIGLSYYVF